MRKAISKIDKVILLCRNVEKTSSIYSQTLGLKVYLQSRHFVELRDANNFCIYLQQSKNPSHLSKGYSPLLSFKVQNFKQVYDKLMRYELIPDGDIIKINESSLITFQGLDGQMISIHDMPDEKQEQVAEDGTLSIQDEQIKRILEKIKM